MPESIIVPFTNIHWKTAELFTAADHLQFQAEKVNPSHCIYWGQGCSAWIAAWLPPGLALPLVHRQLRTSRRRRHL